MPLLPYVYPVAVPRAHCSKPEPLIVKGVNATEGEFPHMVSSITNVILSSPYNILQTLYTLDLSKLTNIIGLLIVI